jgi:CRP/FNR family transcriptional regulator
VVSKAFLPRPVPVPVDLQRGHSPCAACTVRVLSICSAVPDRDTHRLAALVASHHAAAHTMLIVEGDEAEALFNITAGAVKVYKMLADGRQQITGFLFPGDFLGLAPSGRYAYSAEAITDVTWCRFPRRGLERLIDDVPQLERRLLGIASNELAAAQDQMLLLGRKTAREKVASFLVGLSRRAVRNGLPGDPIVLPMIRADIADFLGLTIETVSRVISQLRRDGLIELKSGGEVQLSGLPALARIAEGAELPAE